VQRTDESKVNRNIFCPLLVVGLGLVLLLNGLGVFPPALADLVGRAWPVLLVLVGLALLLDHAAPRRRWAPWRALAVSAGLLVAIVGAAYANRSGQPRQDQTVAFTETIDPGVDRLRVAIVGLDNAVEISPTVGDARQVTAEFVGSADSQVTGTLAPAEDGTLTFTLQETRLADFLPRLEGVGSGRIRVELPAGLPIELDFTQRGGTTSLNLLGLDVARLKVDMAGGDLLLSLPNRSLEQRGEVSVGGNLTVFVPQDLGLQFSASGATPNFAEGAYLLDPSSGVYIARRYDSAPQQTDLSLIVRGTLRLE